MFLYEWKKLFFKKSLFVILLIFTVTDIVKIGHEHHNTTFLTDEKAEGMLSWKEAYWSLYEKYGGKLDEEKVNAFLEYFQPLMEETADMTASSVADNPDYLTGSIQSDYNLLSRLYEMPMRYFYRYERNAKKTAEKARENAAFYREHGNTYESRKNVVLYHLYQDRRIRNFSYTEMLHYYLHYDFSSVLLFLLSIYGIVRVFVCEREAQMEELTVVSIYGGRRLVRYKILAVALYTVLISLWFALVDFASFAVFYQSLEGMDMPVYALENFACASVGCCMWQYILLSFGVRTLGFLVFGMFFLLLSELCNNALVPFVLSVAVSAAGIFIGDAFAATSHILCKAVNPYSLIQVRLLFGRTEFVNVFGIPVLSYELAIVVGVLLCLFFVLAVWFLSKRNVLCVRGRRDCHAVVSA